MTDHPKPVERGFPWLRPVIWIAISVVLVVLAIGLFFPTVTKIRNGGGARATSSNNLGQFARAIHNFNEAFYRLPPALGGGYRAAVGKGYADMFLPVAGAGITFVGGPGAVVSPSFPFSALTTHGFLLPYMEQDPLYTSMKSEKFDTDVAGASREVWLYYPHYGVKGGNGPAFRKQIKSYFSPADPSVSNGQSIKLLVCTRKLPPAAPVPDMPPAPPSGATSYAANFKLFAVLSADESAVTSLDRAWTIAGIPDGAANVVFMAEKYGTCTAAVPIAKAPTNQGIPVEPPGAGGSLWAEPNLNANSPFFAYPQGGNSTYTAGPGLKFQVQPNPYNQKCNPFRAGTPHVGGILLLMGDGSVRTVTSSVSDQTWYRAVTPDDGQKLGDDW